MMSGYPEVQIVIQMNCSTVDCLIHSHFHRWNGRGAFGTILRRPRRTFRQAKEAVNSDRTSHEMQGYIIRYSYRAILFVNFFSYFYLKCKIFFLC